jgi:hypothetical protein
MSACWRLERLGRAVEASTASPTYPRKLRKRGRSWHDPCNLRSVADGLDFGNSVTPQLVRRSVIHWSVIRSGRLASPAEFLFAAHTRRSLWPTGAYLRENPPPSPSLLHVVHALYECLSHAACVHVFVCSCSCVSVGLCPSACVRRPVSPSACVHRRPVSVGSHK